MFKCLNVKKHFIFLIFSTAAAPLFTLCFSACLFKACLQNKNHRYDWSVLAGLSQQHYLFFFLKLCRCSCSHDCVESVDCIIVTSESYRSRDGSFKGAVSKIAFDTFTVYLVSGLVQNSACLEHPQQMLVSDETEICVVQFGEKKILYKWNKKC